MHKGTMVFLFDSGESFQESWDFFTSASDDALRRLIRVAHARLPVLASSIRIVQLKVKGQPLQRVRLTGTGGNWAWPREALVLRHEGRQCGKRLRGLPKEVFAHDRLTPMGHQAFNHFNRTLTECGCVIVRKGEQPETIRRLEAAHSSLYSWKKGKKVTRRKLVTLLGADEAGPFWAHMRAQR